MTSTGEPDAADEFALLVADLFELSAELRRAGEVLAASAGETQARWQLLSVASAGDWTVSSAARRLGVSRQAVQRVADLMVKDGLARYEDNPGHRRSPHVRLTASGRKALALITKRSRSWRARVVEQLPANDIRRIRQDLNEIRSGMERAELR